MSFLTAASERSSSGSGVSGVSDASFSGASSFSFSLVAALVLLAIHLSWGRPSWDVAHHTTPTNPSLYPMRGESNDRRGSAQGGFHPRHHPDSAQSECHRGRLNPD